MVIRYQKKCSHPFSTQKTTQQHLYDGIVAHKTITPPNKSPNASQSHVTKLCTNVHIRAFERMAKDGVLISLNLVQANIATISSIHTHLLNYPVSDVDIDRSIFKQFR
eukprot:92670_1